MLHKFLFFKIGICNITNITLLTNTNEVVYGLWNTTAAGDGMLTTPNSSIYHLSSQGPIKALDQRSSTMYLILGNCYAGENQSYCGINTGLYVTPIQGPTLLKAFQFTTAGDAPGRDPLTITIEGSTAPSSALMLGTSWSLIYNASTGLELDPGRAANGIIQCILSNTIWYTSYRILVTATRNVSNSVQYNEVRLLGYENPNKGT